MNILIIEDEPLVAKDLANMVTRLEPEAHLFPVITSVEEGVRWFMGNEKPALILSDIQLSDGTSFEIFQQVKTACPIIFTTAYDEYALRAFKVNSIDYLLKPIDVNELKAALDKYKSLQNALPLSDELSVFFHSLKGPAQKYKERFLVVYKNALVPVNTMDIAFFHKEELIFLHTRSNQKYISDCNTIEELEHLLNPEHFYRLNRQYIVHVDMVDKIHTTPKGLTVTLKAPYFTQIDISREKASEFKKWMER